jgi:hypothetical protein
MTFDKIAISVSAGAGNARLGIYDLGTDLYPGDLVDDFGAVDVSAGGVKQVTISGDLQLTKGIYYTVWVSDNTPSFRVGLPSWTPLGEDGATGDVTAMGVHWMVTYTYAALPDPFTAGGAVVESGSNRAYGSMYMRVKSLD